MATSKHRAAEPKPARALDESAPPRASRFERAFCSLVAYERPRRLLQLIDEQKQVLTCNSEEFFRLASIQFTAKHPHFRQAVRCAEMLTGVPVDEISCVLVTGGDAEGDDIEVAVAMIGSRKWSSTVEVPAERFAAVWLEARGDA
jgi:hypothetical protein